MPTRKIMARKMTRKIMTRKIMTRKNTIRKHKKRNILRMRWKLRESITKMIRNKKFGIELKWVENVSMDTRYAAEEASIRCGGNLWELIQLKIF